MAEWGWTPDASHTRYLTWNLGTMGWLFHHVKFKIKGLDKPTCQLLPISCKRKVKTGWEGQQRDRRWRKADCVKQVRTRELRVRELLVRRLCVSKLCVRKCVWVAWRWWKRDCVRVRELYVKELCVKLLCGMCGQRQLRQDHRERSWQLLVLAAKNCCWQTAARTVMKTDGSSQVSAAGRRLPRSDGSTCTMKQVKTHEKKKVEFWSISLTILWPSNRCTQRWWPVDSVQYWALNSILQKQKKEEFQIWLEGIKKSRFPWNKSTFQTRYQNPIGCKFRYQMLLQVFISGFLRCSWNSPNMPWFRHLGKVKMHLRAGPEGKFVRCGLLFFWLVPSIYPNAPKISMYDRLGQSLTGHHVSLGDVFSTGPDHGTKCCQEGHR
jgi:hypothetical protein